jgi:hypothetical protein
MAKKQPPTEQEIAEAAYHRYLKRGGQPGNDFDDWIQAERDLLAQLEGNAQAQSPKPRPQAAPKPPARPRAPRKARS